MGQKCEHIEITPSPKLRFCLGLKQAFDVAFSIYGTTDMLEIITTFLLGKFWVECCSYLFETLEGHYAPPQSFLLCQWNFITPWYDYQNVPAWAKGFDQDTLVFSTIRAAGSIPQFQKPEKLLEGEIAVLSPKRGSGFSRYRVIGQSQGVMV